MSKDALAKLWTAVGITGLFLAGNAILHAQGSEIFLPMITYENAERYSTAVYGLAVSAVPYYLMIRLTKVFLRDHGDGSWAGSIPPAFNIDIVPSARMGKEYQLWVSAMFLVVPIICQFLLLRKMFTASVYDNVKDVKVVDGGVANHLFEKFPISVLFGSDYVIGDPKTGVTFFPFWQPWVFLLMEVGLLSYLVSLLIAFAKKRHERRCSA